MEGTDFLPERPEEYPIVTKIYMSPDTEESKEVFVRALEFRSNSAEIEALLTGFVGDVAKRQTRLYESWCHFGGTTLDRKSYLFRAATSTKGELHFVMYSRMEFAFRHVQELKSKTKAASGLSRVRPNPFGMTFYPELANQTFTRLSSVEVAKRVAPIFATLILPVADLIYAFLYARETVLQTELRTTVYILVIAVIFLVWTALAVRLEKYALELAP